MKNSVLELMENSKTGIIINYLSQEHRGNDRFGWHCAVINSHVGNGNEDAPIQCEDKEIDVYYNDCGMHCISKNLNKAIVNAIIEYEKRYNNIEPNSIIAFDNELIELLEEFKNEGIFLCYSSIEDIKRSNELNSAYDFDLMEEIPGWFASADYPLINSYYHRREIGSNRCKTPLEALTQLKDKMKSKINEIIELGKYEEFKEIGQQVRIARQEFKEANDKFYELDLKLYELSNDKANYERNDERLKVLARQNNEKRHKQLMIEQKARELIESVEGGKLNGKQIG